MRSGSPSGVGLAGQPPAVNWDEQLGLSFTDDFASLAWNVTAVEQADADGYGPAYLLSGLSDVGYWYQVGVSWDWPNYGPGYEPGFSMNYEVFNNLGVSVFPRDGGGGLDSFSGPVNDGDIVFLSLNFSAGYVRMTALDLNTSAFAGEIYGAAGGTRFVGTPSAPSNRIGFFSGLMSEWYHVSPYFGNMGSVVYSSQEDVLSSGWMWIGEFDPDNGTSLFSDVTPSAVSYSNSSGLQVFSGHGATVMSNASRFVTGTASLVPVTLSYSVVGDGTGYDAPMLNYSGTGVLYDVAFSESPTTYYMDSGSVWNVSETLGGSSSTEVWANNGTFSGIANSSGTVDFFYYHQYSMSLDYSVLGGGGFSAPNVTYVQFGVAYSGVLPLSVFVDAGSHYMFENVLVPSSSTERWITEDTVLGTVSSAVTAKPKYYHQYAVNVSYSVTGKDNGSAPTMVSTLFGSANSSVLSESPVWVWLDAGASWNLTDPLGGSSSTSRWVANASSVSGVVSSVFTVDPVYVHEYFVVVESNVAAGGSVTPLSGWFAEGGDFEVLAIPLGGWRFESWNGTGGGSYNGTSSVSVLTANSVIVEVATFYPGLTISAVGYGSVSYSFGGVSGSVPAGGSKVLYVPFNSSVALSAGPSFYLFQFISWSGAVSSTAQLVEVSVTAPASVQASFGYNWVSLGVTVAVVAVAIIAVGVSVRLARVRRRGGASEKAQQEGAGGTGGTVQG